MTLSNIQVNSANPPAQPATLDFVERKYPFARWSTVEDGNLHPALVTLWRQVKQKFWYHGHPRANALFHAIYKMSQCESFARDGGQ